MTMTNIGDWKSLAIILPNSVRLESLAIILRNSVKWWIVDCDGDDVVGWYDISYIYRQMTPRFVDFIARFSTDLVYFSYRSSHLSLPIFGTAKSCL